MHRLGLLTLGVVAFGSAACAMDNPAFDAALDHGEGRTDGSEVADSTTEVGDGDPDPTKGDGDGDGDPTTGDGDGEPSETGTSDTGDGDGEATTGDGDGEATTGDGDGEPDPMLECPGFDPVEQCQMCAAESCCTSSISACFMSPGCKCVIDCVLTQNKPPLECANTCQVDVNVVEVAGPLAACLSQSCADVCP